MGKTKQDNVTTLGVGTVNIGFEFDNDTPTSPEAPKNNDASILPPTSPPTTERQQWDRPIEFLLSCIAMSVGLGNVWRFPYTAYDNGGGAFLIPYLIVLFFIGKPLYMLELCIGQFSSKGQVKVWKMSPIFKGVGYGSAMGTACVISYYCSLMALTCYYFVQSFHKVLPWSVCNPNWAKHGVLCANNFTSAISPSNKSIPELYFKIDVLGELESIDDGIGAPDLELSMYLLLSWIIIFVSLIKGVQSAGKVAYFTALFPYVVLAILLVRGVTLEGAWDGIWYFIKPQWSKILEAKVWAAAIAQCFFSLTVGFGPIIMFASYNPFNHNVYQAAMVISVIDTLTSLLAGFTIFAILGNLAHNLGVEIPDVAGKGPALAFASYPLAISKFDILPQVFSMLFFLMLFTLGLGSVTSLTGGLITIIHDQFPKSNKKLITIVVCILGFFAGLIYVTPGGQWMLDLVDYFGSSFVIYATSTIEVIGIVWVYGLDNICRDIEYMLGDKIGGKVGIYWRLCWGFISPVVLIVVSIHSILGIQDGISYEGKEYPFGALVLGWTLAIVAILLIPLFAVHTIVTRKSNGVCAKLSESIRPAADWGPANPSIRQGWLKHIENSPKWAKQTHKFLHELWRNEDGNGGLIGVSMIPVTRVTSEVEYTDPFWSTIVFGFQRMKPEDLHVFRKPSLKTGNTFVTFTCEATKLLPHFLDLFMEQGGRVRIEKVKNIRELGQEFDIVVNCTGVQANKVVPDPTVQPKRGQVMRVIAPSIKWAILDDDDDGNYIIPNQETVVLGGTHQEGDWNTKVYPEDTAFIKKGCYNLIPSLKHATVLKEWVGLRPGRPSVRLEKEKVATILKNGKEKTFTIVHNYGHGGSGLTLFWGCALEASGYVKEAVKELSLSSSDSYNNFNDNNEPLYYVPKSKL